MVTSVPLWLGSGGWMALLSFSPYSGSLSVSKIALLSFAFAVIVHGSHILFVSSGVNSPFPLSNPSKRSLESDHSLLKENLMVDVPATSSTSLTSNNTKEMLRWKLLATTDGEGLDEVEKAVLSFDQMNQYWLDSNKFSHTNQKLPKSAPIPSKDKSPNSPISLIIALKSTQLLYLHQGHQELSTAIIH